MTKKNTMKNQFFEEIDSNEQQCETDARDQAEERIEFYEGLINQFAK